MTSPADQVETNRATIEYARAHKLDDLVDLLIAEVAAARPPNPVSFMGAILQKRIATREATRMHAGDVELAAALAMHQQPQKAKAFPLKGKDKRVQATDVFAEESAKPIKEQCLAHFGIWVHIRYADVPTIVSRFESLLYSQSLATPADATKNMEFFIQMLAAAGTTAHFKGFAEAMKLLPTRAVHLSPQVCDALTEAILASAGKATPSQRQDFISFMQRISRILTGSSATADAAGIGTACTAVQSSETLWKQFVSVAQKSLTRLDPVMAVFGHNFGLYAQQLVRFTQSIIDDSNGFQLYEDGEALRRRVQHLYRLHVKESGVELVPDRYGVFAGLFLRSLQHTLDGRHLTPTAAQRLGTILSFVMEMVNFDAGKMYGDRQCVRMSSMSIMRGTLRFLSYDYRRVPFPAGGAAGFESAHNQRGDSFLKALAAPYGGDSDAMARSFVKVASLVVAAQRDGCGSSVGGGTVGSGAVMRTEPLMVRCYHQAYRSLLQTLVALVTVRTTVTAKDILTVLARSFCFGAPPANLHIHFQGAFSLVTVTPSAAGTDEAATPVTATEREQAKTMLSVLQSACELALHSPVMRDIALSLPLLIEHTEFNRFLSEALCPTFPQGDLPASTVYAFLEASDIITRVLSCFNDASTEAGGEAYFRLITLLAARLRLCGVHLGEADFSARAAAPESVAPLQVSTAHPPSCEFLSMGLLAAMECVERAAPSQKIAPALEAIVGLGPAILAVPPAHAAAHDRSLLYTYFCGKNSNLRLFMRAMEDMLRTFPQYRPRLLHTSFSYETLQQAFHTLLMSLLRVPNGAKEANAAFTTILKPVAVKLAVAGVRPRDYDFFGISLCRVMRAHEFPECEWVAFYTEMAERVVALSPVVKSLESYSADDVRHITKSQRIVRRLLAQRAAHTNRGSALHRLEEVLKEQEEGENPTNFSREKAISFSSAEMSGTAPLSSSTTSTQQSGRSRGLGSSASRIIQLSWESIGTEGQVVSVYHAAAAASTLSTATGATDAEGFLTDSSLSLLERSRGIANNFSILIDALTADGSAGALRAVAGKDSADEPWKKLLQDLFGGSASTFLDGCVPPDRVRAFTQQLVTNICEKVGSRNPTVRISWINFMGAFNTALARE